MIRICPTGEVEMPHLPSGVRRRMQNIRMRCRMRNIRMEYLRRRIPDERHPGGMSAEQNSECETSGWNVFPSGVKRWMRNIRMECRRRRLSDVRHPDGICDATAHVPPPSDGVSGFAYGFQITLLNLGLLW